VLAIADGGEDQRLRRLDAADQFDDDVDLRSRDDGRKVGRQLHVPGSAQGVARTLERPRRNAADADRSPRTARDFLCIAAEHVPRAAPDRAHSEQADPHRLHRRLRH
jgi:hypothetical protein